MPRFRPLDRPTGRSIGWAVGWHDFRLRFWMVQTTSNPVVMDIISLPLPFSHTLHPPITPTRRKLTDAPISSDDGDRRVSGGGGGGYNNGIHAAATTAPHPVARRPGGPRLPGRGRPPLQRQQRRAVLAARQRSVYIKTSPAHSHLMSHASPSPPPPLPPLLLPQGPRTSPPAPSSTPAVSWPSASSLSSSATT